MEINWVILGWLIDMTLNGFLWLIIAAFSLSLIDTGFKRFIQLEEGAHKDRTLDVLKLSIIDHFELCHLEGMKIINYLYSGELFESKKEFILNWHSKVELDLDKINLQKRIVDTLYNMKKYYLD